LKERYEKEMILAIADKFKGDEQKIRQYKFIADSTNPDAKRGRGLSEIEGMLSATM